MVRDGVLLIMRRGGGAGEVINLVIHLADIQQRHNIMLDEGEVFLPASRSIFSRLPE